MRLTFKLPALVVGAMLLTAVAGSGLSILIGRDALRRASLDDSLQKVEIYASAVEFYLEGARAMLAATAQLPELTSIRRARELGGLMVTKSNIFEYVMLLAPDGTVAMQEPRASEERLSHRDLSFSAWFQEVQRTSRIVVSDLHISPATQRPTVVIAVPVLGADGRVLGIWAGALKLGRLSEIGSVAADRLVPRGSGYVTDRRGLILAHQGRPSYVEQQTDFSSVQSVMAALAGRKGSGENVNPVDGERKLAAYRPLSGLGWAVVHAVPTAVELAPLEALTLGILSGSAALAVLIGAGVYFVARRFVAPLAGLTAAAQTIGLGDFSQRIKTSSGDEVGELGAEFNRMAAALEEKNAELQRQAAGLQAANKELEAFSYSVSHDLRAPLRAMDGFSVMLLEDYGDKVDEDGKDALNRIRAASERMGRLIDDMLELSRVNRAELRLARVDLSALAREIADSFQQESPGRAVRWQIEPDVALDADRPLMEIALRNLLANAWKFTGRTAEPVIRVGARRENGAREFFVADNGAGFDMAHAERLFGAFQRLHRADEFPGTGIGLAIVQRVIRRHGGDIRAEARPGEGATFFFTVGNSKEAPHG